MANTTQRISQILEELSSHQQAAGEVYIVCDPSSTWYPYLFENKGYGTQQGGPPLVAPDLATALGYTVSGRGDVIVVAPGSYAPSTEIVVASNNVTIVGAGQLPEATKITGPTTAGTCGLSVTGSNVTIKNLWLVASNGTGYGAKTTGLDTTFDNCFFGTQDGSTPTQAGGLQFDASSATAPLNPKALNCRFILAVRGIQFTSGNGATKVNSGALVKRCYFAGNTAADINSSGTTASNGVLFEDCTFMPGAGGFPLLYTSPALNGLVTNCRFNVAANTQALITNGSALGGNQGYVGNYTQAGLSVAKPT